MTWIALLLTGVVVGWFLGTHHSLKNASASAHETPGIDLFTEWKREMNHISNERRKMKILVSDVRLFYTNDWTEPLIESAKTDDELFAFSAWRILRARSLERTGMLPQNDYPELYLSYMLAPVINDDQRWERLQSAVADRKTMKE